MKTYKKIIFILITAPIFIICSLLFSSINAEAVTTVPVDYLINYTTHQSMFSSDFVESTVLQNNGWTCYATLSEPANSSTPVYRLYNASRNWHFFTTSSSEENNLANSGWSYEGIAFYAGGNVTPIKRYYNTSSGVHGWTVPSGNYESNDLVYYLPNSWNYEGIAWTAYHVTDYYNPVTFA